MIRLTTQSGKKVFPIGIGTWEISSTFNKTIPNYQSLPYNGTKPVYGNEEKEIEAIRYSLDKGQNHIDCAEMYGAFYTDEVIGRAIKGHERKDLFIADKLWKTSLGKGKVRPVVSEMLTKLGTDYIDLLYIHNNWDDVNWVEAISQIDELIDDGTVKHFGVSNFTISDMDKALQVSKHGIFANQMNYNVLYKQDVNDEFLKYCEVNDIALIAYQPVKRKEVIGHRVLKDIAQTHNATEAQIAIAWLLQKGAYPIPKSVTKEHIDQNFDSIGIELAEEEMEILDNIH